MNDIEYMLRQDAREKKAAGRGVYHKHSGKKSRYVGLPSDHMTAAQKRRRNGPVSTYNISKRLSYDEFKRLPSDLASEYVMNVQNTYNVNLRDLATSFGSVTRIALNRYLLNHSIRHRTDRTYGGPDPRWEGFLLGKYSTTGGRIPTPEELAIFEESKPTALPETAKPTPVILEPVEPTTPAPPAKLRYIDLSGVGTPEALLDTFMTAFAGLTNPSGEYEFILHLQLKEEVKPDA